MFFLSSDSPQKGEKNDCCSWPIYKTQLPVTCGNVEGSLSRDRLAKGGKVELNVCSDVFLYSFPFSMWRK